MQLTIITINHNNAAGLQKTMQSVFSQTSKDFEYIVMDGASTDGSVEIIQSFVPSTTQQLNDSTTQRLNDSTTQQLNDSTTQRLNNSTTQQLNYLSEPDSGIYSAMNKGIRMAKGEYVHFLNSGDWLVDEKVVEDMLNELSLNAESVTERSRSADILVGNVISIRPDGKYRKTKHSSKTVSLLTFYRGTIQHTSAYIKRSLFEQYGLYDESLKIVSDWKWYLQVAGLNKANVQFTDRYVTYFDTTGISSTNLELDKAERRQVLEELIPAPILADYDAHSFDIAQMQRLKRYPVIYKTVWFVERVLFKIDKWRGKRGWK